jgi:AraC-like DNA-binding protein
MESNVGFAERLSSLVTRGVSQVVRAVEPGHAGMPRDASVMDEPRCIVALEGEVGFQLREDEGVGEVTLRPGDGLFVAPGRWVRSRPRGSYTSMGAVFYRDAVRFYLMRATGASDRRLAGPAETLVVRPGLPDEGRALCRLLAGAMPGRDAARYYRNAFECLLILARDLLDAPREPAATSKARFTFDAARGFMAEHLHRPLSRKDVARHVGVHPNHLSRLFAEHGGAAFSDYLQELRMERARLLLADPRLNIAEVAQLSGFATANYFTRVFRQRTGMTPTLARGKPT